MLVRGPPPRFVQYLTASLSRACCRAVLPPGMRSLGCCSTCTPVTTTSKPHRTISLSLISCLNSLSPLENSRWAAVGTFPSHVVGKAGCNSPLFGVERHLSPYGLVLRPCRTGRDPRCLSHWQCRVQQRPAALIAERSCAWPPRAPAWLQQQRRCARPLHVVQPAALTALPAAPCPAQTYNEVYLLHVQSGGVCRPVAATQSTPR